MDTEKNYRMVTAVDEIRRYIGDAKIVAFDYETAPDDGFREEEKASLDPAKSHVCTMSMSVRQGTGIEIPIAHKNGMNVDSEVFMAFLKEFLSDTGIIKIAHNLSFESMFSYKYGIVIAEPVYDTIAASQMTLKSATDFRKLADSGLKRLAAELCGEPLPSFSSVTDGKHFDELDPSDPETIRYSCADSDFALRLYYIFNDWFDKFLPTHRWLVEHAESPTAVYLGLMKYNGVQIDTELMAERKTEADREMERIRQEISFIIGDVKIGSNCSTNEFKKYLFKDLGLPVFRTTESNREAADDAVMIQLKDWCDVNRPELSHLFELVQEYRKWNKITSTYITGYLKYQNSVTGRIHPSFYALSTDTGRFSCNQPNLQNAPRKTNDPIGVRNFIKAPEGHIIISCDYSQIELRVGAFYCRDRTMDQVKLIQEMLGYFLIPVNSAQKCFVIVGVASAGKSVLLRVLNDVLLGKQNVSNVSWQALNERFKTAELFGKLANIFADLPTKNIDDNGIFKALVGEDYLTVEKKNKNPFSFQSTARLLFSCNSIPKNYGDRSEGFYRRLIIIRFNHAVPIEKRDPQLVEKFRAEADGIFLFALEGLKRLMDNHYMFSETDANKEELQQYREESDSVLSFVKEYCQLDDSYSSGSTELFNAYKGYCEECGLKPYSQKTFVQQLSASWSVF